MHGRSLASPTSRGGSELRAPRRRLGLGGASVGLIRAVEKPSPSLPRSRGEEAALQRVQGQREARQRGEQDGQAVQAEAQQVRRHDQPRVHCLLWRLQGLSLQDAERRTPRHRIRSRDGSGRSDLG